MRNANARTKRNTIDHTSSAQREEWRLRTCGVIRGGGVVVRLGLLRVSERPSECGNGVVRVRRRFERVAVVEFFGPRFGIAAFRRR